MQSLNIEKILFMDIEVVETKRIGYNSREFELYQKSKNKETEEYYHQ
jgi:hypothetical protein